MFKAIICDLDGSLMPPSSGLYVSEPVKELLIEIQKKGILVILNSARIFQGVYPLAKQILMDTFGGYIISCNGAHIYDVKHKQTFFDYSIPFDDVKKIVDYGLKQNVGIGFSQPNYFVANKLTEGFELDRNNCRLDYILAHDLNIYLKESVCKCCISDTKERMNQNFNLYKSEIEEMCDVKVVHSTSTMVDIISSKCEKYTTVNHLLKKVNMDWKDVSAIGDGLSDASVLQHSGYGVTLENGCSECKKVADRIVPSCFEDGCLEWLKEIVCE